MGVSGAGKSTMGDRLATALGAEFVDGDALHPPSNVARMRAGSALTDDNRRPWLDAVGRSLADAPAPGVVVACSALRRSYRDLLRSHAPDALFVLLTADRAELLARLRNRTGHFMGPALLDSQLATLEPLGPDENSLALDAAGAVDDIVAKAMAFVARPSRIRRVPPAIERVAEGSS